MSHIYKRLQANRPAYTITGSGGGGTHVYHWCEHRSLTNREKARIQTFPDDFVFKGTTEKVRKQIGMAVPTLGAKIIFEHILKTFAGIPYEVADTEYLFSEEEHLSSTKVLIVLPSNKELRRMIVVYMSSHYMFPYSAEEHIYIKGHETNKIYYTCQRERYCIEIDSIMKAVELFRQQEIVSERNLQISFPSDFPMGSYNAFVAIAILNELKIGRMDHPYSKSGMWALVPAWERQ